MTAPKPRAVVLDAHTLNPGDLGWGPLEALTQLVVYPRTPEEQLITRCHGAEIVLTNKTPLVRETLRELPALRLVSVLATGVNVINVDAAREWGITVANVPAYSTASVAQLTIALLLALTHHVEHHSNGVRAGRWTNSPDFSYSEFPLMELAGLQLGVIGLGAIGQRVAAIADAMGMRVQASTRTAQPNSPIQQLHLHELLRTSDVVSLHCPLTPATRHLINASSLNLMKPTALLLNTGRGALIDEAALATALNTGRIAGAGLDVLSEEPPPKDQPLFTARNCLITPHIGWATRAARTRLMAATVENVRDYLVSRVALERI